MNYSFDSVGLGSDIIDKYDDIYKLLRSKFSAEPTGNINFHLENFEVFKGCTNVNVKGSYVIKNTRSDSYMLFVETHQVKRNSLPSESPRYDHYEYQTWGLAYLKKDFGRVLIRPETLADKIIELVHPVELDFDDDKAFSDTFYVLVNDRSKANISIDRNFRNVVMDMRHEDIVIEIINHTLIIGYRRPITPDSSVKLAEFVARIASNC